ncbi:MBL fold metallo-hydrolase [Brevibacillus choshinensis]|uniref:MBL fold metallo-hydrolase n=1 Tax=Brevibacillus choshinensis TaxID=54911 RepID=A0ABX7FPC9_BRECH|nr:MBL fold metallo-hydrolase [Brevibacillus choshinensis]QRG68083.1 MBL fold metallo-hydrolase [Brevibacillus choshinensis]
MHIQLVRHATLRVAYKGRTLLVDPMLSLAGELPATVNTPNQRPNPGVELPMPAEEVLGGVDAILITHTHTDHLDEAAVKQLPKHLPIFCQPPDREKLQNHGFEQVIVVESEYVWEGIQLYRTGGRHGTGEIGEKMGPVSGFVLQAEGEPTLYLAGDTIWCEEVEHALKSHRPDVIVPFAGAAHFLVGDPITMTKEDIVQLAQAAPGSQVFVAHMEVWNHCLLSRDELREHLTNNHLSERVQVPQDGEKIEYKR